MGYSSKASVCTENRFRQFTHFGTYLKPYYTQLLSPMRVPEQNMQEGEILVSFFPCEENKPKVSFDMHSAIK